MNTVGAASCSRLRTRALATLVVIAVTAVMTGAMATMAAGQGKVGPTVKAAGVGTKEALESPNCDESDGKLAYPYQQRAPCVRPFKQGENNGGATAQGVTKDAVKVVIVTTSKETQETNWTQPGVVCPPNRATNACSYTDQTFRDWQTVMDRSFEHWGREIDFTFFTQSGTDEASQRADAVTVSAMKPFAVIGGLAIFATAVAANKIIVIGPGTNTDARSQPGYRWVNGADADAAAFNGGEWLGKQIVGETAKWAGDTSFQNKKRVLGAIYPDRNLDFSLFEKNLKKYGGKDGKLATSVQYTVSPDAAQNLPAMQQNAPTLVAKLKDAGVTSVVLFVASNLMAPVLQAATNLDFKPEWIFIGQFLDLEVLVRTFDTEQWSHAFGIGTLPLPVAGINDPQVAWFDWYWGKNQGSYAAGSVGQIYTLNAGIHLAGPKLSVETFQQGLFAMPAYGGAASDARQSFMFGYGRTSGLPYDEYTNVGLDFAIGWWDPTATGISKITFTPGTGRYFYPNDAKRFHAGQWEKGEPRLFDKSGAIAEFATLPPNDVAPTYPCRGCPSATS